MGSLKLEEFGRVMRGLRDDYGAALPEKELKHRFLSKPEVFAEAVGRFRSEAHGILTTGSDVGALYDLMLDVLEDVGRIGPRTKRRFDEDGPHLPKRRRDIKPSQNRGFVDEIPFRTRSSDPDSNIARASAVGTNSSISSSVSEALRGRSNAGAASSPGTAPPSRRDSYSPDPEERAALEASWTTYSNPSASPSHGSKTVWPQMPEWLERQPLPLQWELMRICRHCEVKPDEISETNLPSNWADPPNISSIWTRTKHIPAFRGKSPPGFVSERTWEAAMKPKLALQNDSCIRLKVEILDLTVASFKMRPLEPDSRSYRLARRFGWDRFLEVTILDPQGRDSGLTSKKPTSERTLEWLQGPHYFLGRRWVPFFIGKGDKKKIMGNTDNNQTDQPKEIHFIPIYFFATNGNDFDKEQPMLPPPEDAYTSKRTKITLESLLNWAIGWNDPANGTMLATKLFSRLALSLSRTIATVVLKPSQIYLLEHDIKDPDHPDGKIMNDGSGRMSRTLARKVALKLGLELGEIPCAFQGRLGSAKGMWIVEDDDRDSEWIETYPSQLKWACDYDNVHHRTLEINDWAKKPKSADLNEQLIPILEEQSTKAGPNRTREILANLLQKTLADKLQPYQDAIGDPKRFLPLLFSALGQEKPRLGSMYKRDDDNVVAAIEAGFDMGSTLIKSGVENHVRLKVAGIDKMKIQVPCSANMFMVPDFTRTLEEGEVHISFSDQFVVDGFSDTLVEGMKVLVARNPAHLPSDIQCVTAVSKSSKLRQLKNVIVFSIKGKRPLADLLSGGDYDGDHAWVCWDQDLVKNFENAPNPPEREGRFDYVGSRYLVQSKLRVQDLRACANQEDDGKCLDMIFAFIFADKVSLGQVTKYKERYCYSMRSSSSESARELSLLASDLVDSTKAGVTLTPENWNRFYRDKVGSWVDKTQLSRDTSYNGHIFDYLKFNVGPEEVDRWRKRIDESMKGRQPKAYDPDLTALANQYERLSASSQTYKKLTAALRNKLRDLGQNWKKRPTGVAVTKTITIGESTLFQDKADDFYQQWLSIAPSDELQASKISLSLTRNNSGELLTEWNLLKASYTHMLFQSDGFESFVWAVAGQHLMHIKACVVAQREGRLPSSIAPHIGRYMKPNNKLINRGGQPEEGTESSLAVEEAEAECLGWDDEEELILDDF